MTNTSTTNLQLFCYENKEIRTVTIDGEPWWIAKEVCQVLGLENVSMAIRGLDEDEKLTSTLMMSGQSREVNLINESGLYGLIIRSNKPEAKAFRKWITSVVLPQIRKTGRYSVEEDLESRRIKSVCKNILETIYNSTLPESSLAVGSLIERIISSSIEDNLDPGKRLLCEHGIRVELEKSQWMLWLSDSCKSISGILQNIQPKRWGVILSRIEGVQRRPSMRFSKSTERATGVPVNSVNALLSSEYSTTVHMSSKSSKSSKFSGTVPEGPKKINLILKSKSNRPVTVILTVD